MRVHLAVWLIVLAACAPQIAPAESGAVVSLYRGGGFHGSARLELSPDDMLRETTIGARGKQVKSASRQLRAGAFVAARDHILDHPIAQKVLEKDGVCMDYGADIVSYSGPDRQIQMRASCPNVRLDRIFDEIEAIIAAHEGATP